MDGLTLSIFFPHPASLAAPGLAPHHHTTYRATAPEGLQAQGVAAAWGTTLAGTPIWPGDKPRLLPRTEGWLYQD